MLGMLIECLQTSESGKGFPWLGWISTSILACLSIVIFYRSVLHPLAEYPGPWTARFTDWYSVYHAYYGDHHLNFYRLHEKYGKVVRFGPNRISICSSAGVKAIYSFDSNVRKSDWYLVFGLTFDVGNVFTILDKHRHAARRRIINGVFSPASIKKWDPHIAKNADEFCKHLAHSANDDGWSTPKDMSQWLGYVTLDSMCDLCCSRNWNLLGREENRDILHAFEEGNTTLSILGYMPWILNSKKDWSFLGRYIKGVRRFKELSKQIFNDRYNASDSVDKNDVIATLTTAKSSDTGSCLTIPDLISEIGLLIVAGSDTTKTAIVASLYYCHQYPDKLQQLQKEVREAFANDDEIQVGPSLHSCKYLRACIEEAMRLSPSVGGLLARQVLPGGIHIDGHFFPAGTEIGVPVYALQHTENYHPDAFAYKPERWLVGNGVSETDIARAQSAFLPFGVGPRACAGRPLAYAEMTMLLAKIVFNFDTRISKVVPTVQRYKLDIEGTKFEHELQTFEGIISITDGPMLEFKRRF